MHPHIPRMSSPESSDDRPLSKREKTESRMNEIKATIAENMRRNGFTNQASIEQFLRQHPNFDISIGDLDVEPRTIRALDTHLKVIRVFELLHCPKEALREVPGIGDTAIAHIFDALRAKNIIKARTTETPSALPPAAAPTSDNGEQLAGRPVSALQQVEYSASVQTLLTKLDAMTTGDGKPRSDEQRGKEISQLSRAIRFELGPPWLQEPAFVDCVAEHLSDAVASINDARQSPELRQYVTNTLQRMLFILDDKHGESPKLWWHKLSALLESAQKAPAA